MSEILDCKKCGQQPLVTMFRNKETKHTHYAFYSPVEEKPHPSYYENLDESPFFLKFQDAAEYWNQKQESNLTDSQKTAILRSQRLKERIDLHEVRKRVFIRYFSFLDEPEASYAFLRGVESAIPYLKKDVVRFVDYVVQYRETIPDGLQLVESYLEEFPYVKDEYYGIEKRISEDAEQSEKTVQSEDESTSRMDQETGETPSEE